MNASDPDRFASTNSSPSTSRRMRDPLSKSSLPVTAGKIPRPSRPDGSRLESEVRRCGPHPAESEVTPTQIPRAARKWTRVTSPPVGALVPSGRVAGGQSSVADARARISDEPGRLGPDSGVLDAGPRRLLALESFCTDGLVTALADPIGPYSEAADAGVVMVVATRP